MSSTATPSDAAMAAEEIYRLSWRARSCGLDYEIIPELTPIIQQAIDSAVAERTRELVEEIRRLKMGIPTTRDGAPILNGGHYITSGKVPTRAILVPIFSCTVLDESMNRFRTTTEADVYSSEAALASTHKKHP